jgi:hypothetical protein
VTATKCPSIRLLLGWPAGVSFWDIHSTLYSIHNTPVIRAICITSVLRGRYIIQHAFTASKWMDFDRVTAVEFGHELKLYVGTVKGKIRKITIE